MTEKKNLMIITTRRTERQRKEKVRGVYEHEETEMLAEEVGKSMRNRKKRNHSKRINEEDIHANAFIYAQR